MKRISALLLFLPFFGCSYQTMEFDQGRVILAAEKGDFRPSKEIALYNGKATNHYTIKDSRTWIRVKEAMDTKNPVRVVYHCTPGAWFNSESGCFVDKLELL